MEVRVRVRVGVRVIVRVIAIVCGLWFMVYALRFMVYGL